MEEGSDDVVVGHGDVACVGALREVGNRGQKNLGVPIWGGHHEGAFCEGFEQVCTGVVMRVAACGGEKGDEEGRGNREETDGLLEGIEGGGGAYGGDAGSDVSGVVREGEEGTESFDSRGVGE